MSFPFTEKITSLNPPASLLEILIISSSHFFLEHTFSYILNKSEQNNDASRPPVPALISTIAFFSSSSSLGKRNNFNFFSYSTFLTLISFKSFEPFLSFLHHLIYHSKFALNRFYLFQNLHIPLQQR